MSYLSKVQEILATIEQQEENAIAAAANMIFNNIEAGGILQLFGSGHSQLLAQEAYYRAGGLVPAKPISIEALMLHKGALTSSKNEKDPTIIQANLQHIQLEKNDVLIVISTSGRNTVPVDIALLAKKQGIPVIAIQSLKYIDQPSKHASNKRLEEVVDLVLNTHAPVGDGLIEQHNLQYGPVSTIAGAAILNEVLVRVVTLMQQTNSSTPVFSSSNVENSSTSNEVFIEKYKHRINFN
ncbi:sugar isomerase domain-containing protein [Kurthia sibirica]|uniref:SIS domain-containing protein n=1 Tax=Kurthia sibirica TaxID=202750 RepID=A0A2U3AIJ1_9BACL|nr:SIS domain-containing protein [Kurthia sibirica]PWI24355.1 hypothetical protein DEX24_14125 [Kurthia sibirica]GEK33359.1 hypothetical protein KSI01_08920 [Kurthia sibirica]